VLASQEVDCLIVDARTQAAIADIAKAVQGRRQNSTRLPVLVLADAKREVERALQNCEGITLRNVHTRERLVDLAAFFLHRRVTRLPAKQHRLLEDMHQSDAVLKGRKVLVVDDDIRNIFALTSVLEEHDMNVISAGNGRDALHHDARDGRHGHHAGSAQAALLPRSADHRRHGQGHEGRSRAVHRGRRLGLSVQAGRSASHAGCHAFLALSVAATLREFPWIASSAPTS
jgi:hypothetical protein